MGNFRRLAVMAGACAAWSGLISVVVNPEFGVGAVIALLGGSLFITARWNRDWTDL